jgi:LPS-assembly protein
MLNFFRLFLTLACVAYCSRAYAQLPPPGPATVPTVQPPTPAPPVVPPTTPPTTPPATPPAPSLARPAPPSAPVTETTLSTSREASNNQQDWHFIGNVEMDRGGDTKIYADDVWAYTGENRAIATGNVLYAQGNNRISAERADFDTETRLGTFYNAWGLSTIKPPVQTARPGQLVAPQMANEEIVVYFFGETIEKIGPKKYKITNGGFSTCVQPTPRWDLNAGTVILNIDHYTVLKQAILRVKGVPMFYLPLMYYPTKREDRATGFLIPTYGSSTLNGQAIHNAFFWAINRSQDATIEHDLYSKTGQETGTEYRYNMGSGEGLLRGRFRDQHATQYESGGSLPDARSYDIRGSATQILPYRLRARANVSYFSSLESSRLNNVNIYDLSRNSRSYGGNLVGNWGKYSMSSTFDHSEYFYDSTSSVLAGTWPRVTFSRSERPIGSTPLYFSASTEAAGILRNRRNGAVEVDTSLNRFDVSPQIRYPFKKWQWFTINSSLNWRDTLYSRSYAPRTDPRNQPAIVTEENLNRPVFIFQSQFVGPLFNRVWDTPGNGYAEKFKHTIEPVVTLQRISSVDNFDRILVFDGIDQYVGGTNLTYGLNNRFYAKRKLAAGAPAVAREIVAVEVSQTYYTDERSARYDARSSTPGAAPPSHFSPLTLNVRVVPTDTITGNVRAEFDSRTGELFQISAQGTHNWTGRIQTSAGWSKRAFVEGLTGYDNPAFLTHYVNVSTNAHTLDNRLGTTYSFNYDVLQSKMTQQGITAFYNAQCCGIAFQYQTYAYGSAAPIPIDQRFFLSFTLAGLGNFSPFNGGLSGVPR